MKIFYELDYTTSSTNVSFDYDSMIAEADGY